MTVERNDTTRNNNIPKGNQFQNTDKVYQKLEIALSNLDKAINHNQRLLDPSSPSQARESKIRHYKFKRPVIF